MTTPETPKQTSTSSSQWAALLVSIISSLIVAFIIWVMFQHVQMMHADMSPALLEDITLEDCDTAECSLLEAQLNLEQKMIAHRNERVVSMLSSRLSLGVISLVVALIIIVFGGVLIFDRAIGHGQRLEASEGGEQGRKVSLTTPFAGVILCLIGAVLAAVAMYIPISGGAKISVLDIPVYTADENAFRRVTERFAGINPEPDVPQGSDTDQSPPNTGGNNDIENSLTEPLQNRSGLFQ